MSEQTDIEWFNKEEFKDYKVTFNAQWLFNIAREIDAAVSNKKYNKVLDLALNLQEDITADIQRQYDGEEEDEE
jgi:hypothetical protein